MVDYWLRRLYAPDSQKGILAVLRDGASAHLASGLQRTADHFFADVRERLDVSTDGQQRVVDAPLPVDSSLVAELGALVRRLGARAESVQDEGVRAELQSLIRRGGAMRDALHSFLVQGLPDHVYWVEAAGRRQRNTALQSAPIDVADGLREHLFEAVPSVLLTSATLAIDHRLDYVQHRLGVESAQSVQLGSPFQFERQMRILIPESMPDPNDGETYCRAAAEAIVHFARRTRGRAFVLFTSARMMKEVAGAARGELESGGYQLLVQDAGLPRHQMLEQFRLDGRCVLFGLDSFWTGVDVRGEALSNVMIARLPFAVPDQPIVQARMRRIRERGGDPFKEYTLPEAILKFRQGVGRLIRTATDQGIVVVLDPRIRTKWYGRLFIRSLPECPVEVVPMV
jgi:ATP-dependent DNA helicase DinG